MNLPFLGTCTYTREEFKVDHSEMKSDVSEVDSFN